jgi:hypothetical protein
MTGLVRKATLLGVCGLLAASVVSANVPSRANSSIPQSNPGTCPPADPECAYGFLKVVGTNAGTPDASGLFTVTVRDFTNNPISGSRVVIDLSNCTETRLCSVAIAGQTVNCSGPPNRHVSAVTNAAGQVSMTVLGAGNDPGTIPAGAGGQPGPGAGCVTVFADGVDLGNMTAVVYDTDGALSGPPNGVNALDLSKLRVTLGAGIYRGRADYNTDGSVNALDLSFYRPIIGGGASASGCFDVAPAAYCP